MTTYVRAPEAARRLGVSTSTLYAYVSRGRIGRITGADGRASLFDLAEVDALRERSRRRPSPPPPTIDVRITSAVTHLSEEQLAYRGHPVDELLAHRFESTAELLWTGELPRRSPTWPRPEEPASVSARSGPPTILGLIELATALAADTHRVEPADQARRFLTTIPVWFGAPEPTTPDTDTPSYAARLAMLWDVEPTDAFVRLVDTVLVLLADHELATSTLAVRVAASTRSAPMMALIAGLATLDGDFHGSASARVHEMFDDAERLGPDAVLARYREHRERVPGFGHSIYRQVDPRFQPLLDRVLDLPDPHGRGHVVHDLVQRAAPSVPRAPNVDLALGAFTFLAGLDPNTPIFAIARVAGWTAHYLEELDERPLRYRGLARAR